MGNLTVRYDSPSARRHPRVLAPAWVEIDGRRHSTVDWSVGGFRIGDYVGDARAGDERPIRFFLNFQGFEIGFGARAKFRGVDPGLKQASGEFIGLGQRESDLLRHFVAGLTTGEMTTLSDTLVHIDGPTSVANWGRAPLATAQDPAARDSESRRGLMQRSLYFLAGPLLAGYGILAGYQSIFRMEIQSAVVVRPTETVVAQGIGHLETMLVREGQIVTAGQPLFTAVDDEHGRGLEARRFELSTARAELVTAQAQHAAAAEQQRIYELIAKHKQKVAAERVVALKIQTESAQRSLARVEALVRDGLERASALDEAKAAHAKVKGELDESLPELELANDALKAARHGRFYDGFRLIAELPDETIRLEAARERVRLAEQQLAAVDGGTATTTYTAPFRGRVVRITKSPGSTVDRGETLALVERIDEEPRIYALLTQDQANRVQLGEAGIVRVPTLRQRFRAVVVASDRSGAIPGGVLSTLLANASRAHTSDPTGSLEMQIQALDPAARNSLRAGMPAIVDLPRQTSGSPWHGLSAWPW